MRRFVRAPALIRHALRIGFITKAQAELYLANYRYYRQQRPIIRGLHRGKWIASLNHKIFVADTDKGIHSAISKKKDWRRAYIRFIGRTV
jgi:hypothetical protein